MSLLISVEEDIWLGINTFVEYSEEEEGSDSELGLVV